MTFSQVFQNPHDDLLFLADKIALTRRGRSPVEAAVLRGLRHMLGLDALAARQIGDGAGHFQQTVVCPVAESQLGVQPVQQTLRFPGKNRMSFQHPPLQLAVPTNSRSLVANPLHLIRVHHQTPRFGGCQPFPIRQRFRRMFVLPRQLHLQIDPVQERSGNARTIPEDGTFRAGTSLVGGEVAAEFAAGATVQITTLEITPFSIRLPFSQSHLGRQ